MSFRPPPVLPSAPTRRHPYAHARRLPEGDAKVDLASLLPGEGPFEIEIGPGRGGFIIERSAAAPDARILGLEIRLKWAAIVDHRLAKAGFGARAQVLAEDARLALPRLVPDGGVRAVFLHFPDPWWKKRHEKRLVMGPSLLDEIARLLPKGGDLFVQTDVEERADLYQEQISAHSSFVMAGDEAGSPRVSENRYGARSHRERRAMADGLPIHRMLYRRA